MLKYTTLAILICFAVSCKKESTNVTPPPVDTTSTAAVFSLKDASGNCNPIVAEGTYISGTPLDATNRVILQVNVTTKGTYSLAISTGNGYGFSAAGSFTTTGQQQLILAGNGTPANSAVNNLAVTAQGATCTFSITVFSPLPVVYNDNDHMYFGNPGNAATRSDSVNNYLMRKPYYAVSYSRDRGIPNWVSWHLYAADLGTISRQEDFRPDSSLPAGWYRVPETAYANSGFDKGHNAPSGDRTSTADANSSTFLMTNMIPQAPTNNQGLWARFEDSVRRFATLGYEVYIIMGTYGIGGIGTLGFATNLDAGRVTVPANIWKIAVVLPNGDNDASRVNLATRVIAVSVPNSAPSLNSWKDYRVSVDAIEAATGYDLLSNLPATFQADLEARIDNL